MSYNESIAPKLSRNPKGQRSTNFISPCTSKKSSTTLNQSFNFTSLSQFQTNKSRKSLDAYPVKNLFKKHKNDSFIKET
jgi:hypothetical protein